jgi:hypothetical protein
LSARARVVISLRWPRWLLRSSAVVVIIAHKLAGSLYSVKVTTRNALCGLAKLQRVARMLSNARATAWPIPQGNVRQMIELLTSANSNLIVVPAHRGVRALIFPVVTNFHKMARRPGGVSRQQALRNAQNELKRFVHQAIAANRAT